MRNTVPFATSLFRQKVVCPCIIKMSKIMGKPFGNKKAIIEEAIKILSEANGVLEHLYEINHFSETEPEHSEKGATPKKI